MRVVYMGTPEFSVRALENIAKEHQVVGVYTQPDRPVGRGMQLEASPVKKMAIELNVPVFQPKNFKEEGAFETLKNLLPDVIVVAAFGQILRKNVLELPKHGCINIHASILPRWRGAAPIQWSILEGDTETGVTTMQMNEGLDTGDIIEIAKTKILDTDTGETLTDRLSILGAELILSTLKLAEKGNLNRISQSELEKQTPATYAKKLTKEMQWLSSKQPAVELDRKIRAFDPWPGTRIKTHSGESFKVKKAKLRTDIQSTPGVIFERAGMLMIGTPKGALELLSIQPDGKRAQNAAEFLNGLRGRGIDLPIEVE